MLIIAHRGASALEPENTLRAIQRAIDLKVDMIEVDLYQIENQLIVFHDKTLERTTNGTGKLADHSFRQLRELDAGKGEKIPTLAEVLEMTRGKVALNIEIKGAGLIPLLSKTVRDETDILVSSFDWSQLRELRLLDAEIPLGVLGEDSLDTAAELGAVAVIPSISVVDADYVERAHKLSLSVYSYTIKTDAHWLKAKRVGVDGCFVDNPAVYSQD